MWPFKKKSLDTPDTSIKNEHIYESLPKCINCKWMVYCIPSNIKDTKKDYYCARPKYDIKYLVDGASFINICVKERVSSNNNCGEIGKYFEHKPVENNNNSKKKSIKKGEKNA